MEVWSEIGSTAGEIYNMLKDTDKPMSVHSIKERLKYRSLAEYAIGWLAREGKLEIIREKGKIDVKLKK